MIVGYARVSTIEQDLSVQEKQLLDAGCEKIFAEKMSGTKAANREQLQVCLDFVREGDILVVTRLDRIARSSLDLHNIIAGLEKKGVGFRCAVQAGVDTTTSQGRLMIGMLGAVAEFENRLRRERQMEGIARAKSEGRYKGGKARIDPARVKAMLSEGRSPVEVARALGINRASVYRLGR